VEVTKYLLRMSLKSLQSMRMCLTVTETTPQQSQVGITEPLIGSQYSFIHSFDRPTVTYSAMSAETATETQA